MKPREIHKHKIDSFNKEFVEVMCVDALGDPNIDGHEYRIEYIYPSLDEDVVKLKFQKGPWSVGEDANGITLESIIAVAIDKLECYQRGAFKCRENACALTHLEEALHWLGARADDRERRGVEGKNEP